MQIRKFRYLVFLLIPLGILAMSNSVGIVQNINFATNMTDITVESPAEKLDNRVPADASDTLIDPNTDYMRTINFTSTQALALYDLNIIIVAFDDGAYKIGFIRINGLKYTWLSNMTMAG